MEHYEKFHFQTEKIQLTEQKLSKSYFFMDFTADHYVNSR